MTGASQSFHQFQPALVIKREVGNRAMEGTTLNNIGLVYQAQGRYPEALNQFQQALVIAQEISLAELERAVLANIESLPDAK